MVVFNLSRIVARLRTASAPAIAMAGGTAGFSSRDVSPTS